MSATCDECGREVPPEEAHEGPFVTAAGRWWCLACIVERSTEAEAQAEPMTAAEILDRLYGLQP